MKSISFRLLSPPGRTLWTIRTAASTHEIYWGVYTFVCRYFVSIGGEKSPPRHKVTKIFLKRFSLSNEAVLTFSQSIISRKFENRMGIAHPIF